MAFRILVEETVKDDNVGEQFVKRYEQIVDVLDLHAVMGAVNKNRRIRTPKKADDK